MELQNTFDIPAMGKEVNMESTYKSLIQWMFVLGVTLISVSVGASTCDSILDKQAPACDEQSNRQWMLKAVEDLSVGRVPLADEQQLHDDSAEPLSAPLLYSYREPKTAVVSESGPLLLILCGLISFVLVRAKRLNSK
jgi:hypothetical protein